MAFAKVLEKSADQLLLLVDCTDDDSETHPGLPWATPGYAVMLLHLAGCDLFKIAPRFSFERETSLKRWLPKLVSSVELVDQTNFRPTDDSFCWTIRAVGIEERLTKSLAVGDSWDVGQLGDAVDPWNQPGQLRAELNSPINPNQPVARPNPNLDAGTVQQLLAEQRWTAEAQAGDIADLIRDLILEGSSSDKLKLTFLLKKVVQDKRTPRAQDLCEWFNAAGVGQRFWPIETLATLSEPQIGRLPIAADLRLDVVRHALSNVTDIRSGFVCAYVASKLRDEELDPAWKSVSSSASRGLAEVFLLLGTLGKAKGVQKATLVSLSNARRKNMPARVTVEQSVTLAIETLARLALHFHHKESFDIEGTARLAELLAKGSGLNILTRALSTLSLKNKKALASAARVKLDL